MVDDGGPLAQKLPVPVLGGQGGHIGNARLFLLEVFLQDQDRVILLGCARAGCRIDIVPADAQQLAIGNAVKVLVRDGAVHEVEVGGEETRAVVEVCGDLVLIGIKVEVPHVTRNDEVVVERNPACRFENGIRGYETGLERLPDRGLVLFGQDQDLGDVVKKTGVVMLLPVIVRVVMLHG